jgi:apolipoprotein N-acyltransferase
LEQFTPGTLKMEISSRQENTLASGLGTGFWAVFGGLILIAGAIVYRR